MDFAIRGAKFLFDRYHVSASSCQSEYHFCDPSFVAALSCRIAEDTLKAFEYAYAGNMSALTRRYQKFFFFDDFEVPVDTMNAIGLPTFMGVRYALMAKAFGKAHVVDSVEAVVTNDWPGMLGGCCVDDLLLLAEILGITFDLTSGEYDNASNNQALALDKHRLDQYSENTARSSMYSNIVLAMAEGLRWGGQRNSSAASAIGCSRALKKHAVDPGPWLLDVSARLLHPYASR